MAYVKIDLDTFNHAKDNLTDLADKINALACMFKSVSEYDGSEIRFDLSSSKGVYLILNEVVESLYSIADDELRGEEISENLTK